MVEAVKNESESEKQLEWAQVAMMLAWASYKGAKKKPLIKM